MAIPANSYWRQLSQDEIASGAHRDFVGGLWDEMGALQFNFLKSKGLVATSTMLDVGCGALRGGVHFIRFLDPGNYCGIDINASLLEAGKMELQRSGIVGRNESLLADAEFSVQSFNRKFDFALAISVFTHLPMNSIIRCLTNVAQVLSAGGRFYASWFQAPSSAHLAKLVHDPGGVTTYYDQDPYHYGAEEVRWMASQAGLVARRCDEWRHPRGQQMAEFSLPSAK